MLYHKILVVGSEDPDEMRSLVRAFAIRIYPESTLSHGVAQLYN